MNGRQLAQVLTPFVVAAVLFGLYHWNPGGAQGGSFPPGPGFDQDETHFEDAWDLVRAIENERLAAKVDLEDEMAMVKPMPDPIRIAFVSGTNVPASERETLERFAALVLSDPTLSLRVIGCADPPGAAALNKRISQRRAEAVAAELEGLGVAEERFATIVGRGEECEVPERVVNVDAVRKTAEVARPDPDDGSSAAA